MPVPPSALLRKRLPLPLVLALLTVPALVSGCKTAPTAQSSSVAPVPAPGATITPTALPVLKQKLLSKTPLNLNDQVALRSMPPGDRQKLMAEVRQAK